MAQTMLNDHIICQLMQDVTMESYNSALHIFISFEGRLAMTCL